MKTYLHGLAKILNEGEEREDRTGTGVIGIFGTQQRYNLERSFPAVTTKKLAWKSVVSELLWFIEGSGDERRLCEILHGTRNSDKTTIWTQNANADYWKRKAEYEGDCGRIYGVQWRHWIASSIKHAPELNASIVVQTEIDQLSNLINGIKTDPYGRRHILSAWNPGELNCMALPPCHVFAQFYVSKSNKLSCQLYQRSNDMFLGCPFNIASYSLLTHMIAQVCNLKVGEFIHTTGDAHIYLNHIDQVKEQLSRTPWQSPKLWLNPDITDIDKFTMNDVKLVGYEHHPPITANMAV